MVIQTLTHFENGCDINMYFMLDRLKHGTGAVFSSRDNTRVCKTDKVKMSVCKEERLYDVTFILNVR